MVLCAGGVEFRGAFSSILSSCKRRAVKSFMSRQMDEIGTNDLGLSGGSSLLELRGYRALKFVNTSILRITARHIFSLYNIHGPDIPLFDGNSTIKLIEFYC